MPPRPMPTRVLRLTRLSSYRPSSSMGQARSSGSPMRCSPTTPLARGILAGLRHVASAPLGMLRGVGYAFRAASM